MRRSQRKFGRKSNVLITTIVFAFIMILALVLWFQSSTTSPHVKLKPSVEELKEELDKLKEEVKEEAAVTEGRIKIIDEQQQVISEKQKLNDEERRKLNDKQQQQRLENLEATIKATKINKLDAEIMALKPELQSLKEDLEPKNKVLETKINTISEQQGNFISGVVWILGLFTIGNLLKDYIIKDAEIKDLKSKITEELDNGLKEINEKSMRQIQRKQLLFDYQTAVLAAERLEYDYYANPDEYYLCITAISERVRAIELLSRIQISAKLDVETEYYLKQLSKMINLDIEKNVNSVNDLLINSDTKGKNYIFALIKISKVNDILNKMPEEFKKETADIIRKIYSTVP